MYIYHEFLVKANSLDEAIATVKRFLRLYELVCYDEVVVLSERCLKGWDEDFPARIEAAQAENRRVVNSLIEELKGVGVANMESISLIPQGFESKIFHTLAHMLDGFFGPDSSFFNLVEDSHWVSKGLLGELKARPEDYWLVAVEGRFSAEFQGFEAKSPHALRKLMG